MPEDTKKVFDEAAVAASATCTRSGAFALLLSVALFTMVPSWVHRGEQLALVEYVTLRLSLAGAIEMLDGSINWKIYLASNPEAESKTVAELLKVQVRSAPSPPVKSAASEASAAVPRRAPGYRPAPPTNFQISAISPIEAIPQIADLLVKLDDSQLLTKSRNVSIFYNYSIYRWAIKRETLASRNMASSGGVLGESPPDASAPANFVPPWGRELLLNNLTIKDVRQLASYELPQLSDTTSIGVTGEREIDVSPGSLPRTLFAATLCAESLLLFVIIFFGAFAREAASSESFPVPGTVFSAFAKSRWTLGVFATALCVPMVASSGVLLVSRNWEFLLLSVLICCAVCWTFYVLQQKRYFGDYSWVARALRRVSDSRSDSPAS